MEAYNEEMMQAIAAQVKSVQNDAIHEALWLQVVLEGIKAGARRDDDPVDVADEILKDFRFRFENNGGTVQ